MSRAPLTRIESVAAPLLLSNIDTDVIIQVDRMVSMNPSDLAPFALEALRFRSDGSPDPNFALNQDRFHGACILIAGENFGCGSSREPAVWALQGIGIQCIIAPSFGDIFEANCHQNGLLTAVLPRQEVLEIAAVAERGETMTVDIEAQLISAGDACWAFPIGAMRKLALLEGLDDLELARRDMDLVVEWEDRSKANTAWAWTTSRVGGSHHG
jgi:3-isopropylmalate/(R)-2-methylmalate dehydratase small subunit